MAVRWSGWKRNLSGYYKQATRRGELLAELVVVKKGPTSFRAVAYEVAGGRRVTKGRIDVPTLTLAKQYAEYWGGIRNTMPSTRRVTDEELGLKSRKRAGSR